MSNENKNVVYCYDSMHKKLKDVRFFDNLEDCFNFISEQNIKYTKNVKAHIEQKELFLELDLY